MQLTKMKLANNAVTWKGKSKFKTSKSNKKYTLKRFPKIINF